MSYEAVRTHLLRCRQHREGSREEFHSLIDALEQLTHAVESDMTQIKVALSHLARLIEEDDDG